MLNNLEEGKQVKIMACFWKAYSNILRSVFATKQALDEIGLLENGHEPLLYADVFLSGP